MKEVFKVVKFVWIEFYWRRTPRSWRRRPFTYASKWKSLSLSSSSCRCLLKVASWQPLWRQEPCGWDALRDSETELRWLTPKFFSWCGEGGDLVRNQTKTGPRARKYVWPWQKQASWADHENLGIFLHTVLPQDEGFCQTRVANPWAELRKH